MGNILAQGVSYLKYNEYNNSTIIIYIILKREKLTDEQVMRTNKEVMVNVIFAYIGMFVLQIKIHHGYLNPAK